MIELKTRIRKWGNSFGLVIPKKEINRENFIEGEEIVLLIKKKNRNKVLREGFGMFKFKKPVSKIMKEIDKELYND